MKIRMKLPYEQLNPFPVMGKDAFVAFAKELYEYLRNQVIEEHATARGLIIIPSPQQFRRYGSNGSISGANVDIAEIVGTCRNPFETKPKYHQEWTRDYTFTADCPVSPKNYPNDNQFSIDALADFELSNIAFMKLRVPNSRDSEKLRDILNKTRQMVYERSALVHRGLFGGYYL